LGPHPRDSRSTNLAHAPRAVTGAVSQAEDGFPDAARPTLNALKRTPLLYQIQEEIKSYIIRNGLGPGDALPSEGDLARQLGISRNSVREAVKSLDVLGVVESRPGSGLFVKAFSFDAIVDNLPYGLLFDVKTVSDLLEVRAHLEYGLVDRVIESVTEAQLADLLVVLTAMADAAATGRYDADADKRFHQLLYQHLDNPVLVRVLDMMWLVVRRARELSQVVDPTDPIETVHSHERIYAALEARDVEAMRAAFDHHYRRWQLRIRPNDGDGPGA
jgi:DNA-binding FadR family transcriptional regulator